jgi:glycosyltransferase involved in cell wall biosynthesis
MRILHVDSSRLWRGGQAQVLLLMRGLREAGHRCWVLTPPGSPLARRAAQEDFPVLALHGRGELSPLALRDAWRAIARVRPDVVHVHTAHATAPLLAAAAHGVPARVLSVRVSFPRRGGALGRWKYARLAHRVLAVSRRIAELLEDWGVPPERIRVVPSAYDPARLEPVPQRREARERLGIPRDAPCVLYLGALAAHKGMEILLAAMEALWREGDLAQARLLLAGEGPERGRIEARLREGTGVDRVRLLGPRDDVARLLAAADVLVLPSVSGEGSPAVLKEAMHCARPVVATRHGGIEEIVTPGETGLLVPPGDPAALARALEGLLRDEALRRRMGEAGTRAATRFRPEALAAATLAVYEELVSSRQ